jgi:putative ABC transport system permease protein
MRELMHNLWLRAKNLLKRKQLDRDLQEELAFHLEMREAQCRANGIDAEEARYAARRQLGNTTRLQEIVREMWTFASLETLWRDLRYGARALRSNPGFTAIAVLTLALGVGANTALFSVVKTVLLDSLPYRQPDRLVILARGDSQTPHPTNVSFGEVEDWKIRTHSLQQIALFRGWSPASTGNGAPQMVYSLRVTRNFFDVLGVAPFLGRGFLPEEDRPDRWHVTLLSYPYWIRRFGGNPNALGQTILLDQIPFQIVGVLPSNFEPLSFTDAGSPPDVWIPLGYAQSQPNACRTCQNLHAIARLTDGVSLEQARAEMNTIAVQLAREFPKDYPPDATVVILPLRESWYGKIELALWILLGATSMVLLIACVNVANLFLARGTQKRREIAVRSTLGASPFRIARQLLTESLLLSSLAGIAGVLLAQWGTELVLKWTPADLPRTNGLHFDLGIFLFSLAVVTATGIVVGLLPVLDSWRIDHREALQQSSRGVRGLASSRIRFWLVASQVGLAFVLTIGSGLLLKSFLRAWKVDPGFQVQNLYEVNFSLIGRKYDNDAAFVRAQTEVLARISHIAGVESAALTSTPPMAGGFGGFDQAGFVIQDRRVPDPQVPSVDRYFVSADYFNVLGIPLLRGRLFTETDSTVTNPVAIISDMTARQIFPGEDPLGKRIQLGGRRDDRPWAEIVGIVGDVHQYGLDSPATPQAYLLYSQFPFDYPTVLFVRSRVGAAALTRAVEEQIWALDKNTLVFNPAFMREILSSSLAQRRFTMCLLGAFGILALLLAAIGIYGVMSYMVARRTGEIGIRMALGGQRRHMLALVSKEGMLWTGFGLLGGLLISLSLMRILASQLFEVSPIDPLTFGAVLALLGCVALAACYVPARRATRVDPMVALRHE